MIVFTQAAIDAQNAEAVGKAAVPYQTEGRAADSPQNTGPLTQVRLPWMVDVQGDGPVASAVRYRQPGLQPVDPDSAGAATAGVPRAGGAW